MNHHQLNSDHPPNKEPENNDDDDELYSDVLGCIDNEMHKLDDFPIDTQYIDQYEYNMFHYCDLSAYSDDDSFKPPGSSNNNDSNPQESPNNDDSNPQESPNNNDSNPLPYDPGSPVTQNSDIESCSSPISSDVEVVQLSEAKTNYNITPANLSNPIPISFVYPVPIFSFPPNYVFNAQPINPMFQTSNFSSDLGSNAWSYSANECIPTGLSRFIGFLQYKIKGDRNVRFKKELLHSLYEIFQKKLNLEPLQRKDKRNKMRVFKKLYQVKDDVIFLINKYPKIYLEPIFLTH